ncbi:TRAP transporter small permease [Bacillus sp. JJ1533]|uniref:TRAP transporter small permease subunit n=1 Tax=Bacillus sp. JJ1533 TaxID=3122959 RepID=UPI002FFFF6D1
MEKSSNKFVRGFTKMASFLSFIGAIWIFLIMLMIVYDVGARNLFNSTFMGTSEIVRNSIVGITFLQMAHVLNNNRHIRTTIILDKLPDKWKSVLNGFASILGFGLFFLIFIKSWDPTWTALSSGEYEGEGALRVPTFPAHFLVMLGSLVMAIQFTINFINSLWTIFSKSKEVKDDISI